MDLRKGPNYYFQPTEYVRKEVVSGNVVQQVDLNTKFVPGNSKTATPYKPSFVPNYIDANTQYRTHDDTLNLNPPIAFDTKPREDLFVKPNPTQAELIASLLGGGRGNTKDAEPSYYREVNERRGGQSSLSAMNSMRGESSYLYNGK